VSSRLKVGTGDTSLPNPNLRRTRDLLLPHLLSRREWTLKAVIEHLSAIRIQRVKIAHTEFDQVTQPDDDQQRILDLLGVKL